MIGRRQFKTILILTLLLELSGSKLFAQNTAKILSWNVLDCPNTTAIASDTTQRFPAYRTVLSYAIPDVFISCENNGSVGLNWFLSQVLNSTTSGYHYSLGTFVNGYDTDNALFYRDSLFRFVSNVPIATALRDINQFTLVYKPTGDTVTIFMCHLKAATGFETERGAEVMNLRTVTNAFPAGKNFLIGGDFNIYTTTEPAYMNLVQDNVGDDGNFVDPLANLSGIYNTFGYAPYHTQSTRTTPGPGGGSTGGLDDRFDMILYSNAVSQPGGVYFVPGSFINIGNDGHHYNLDINYGTNTAVPTNVANALYTASDHLPVRLTLQFGSASGFEDANGSVVGLQIYPQPVTRQSICSFTLSRPSDVNLRITDLSGRIVMEKSLGMLPTGNVEIPINASGSLSDGLYFFSIIANNALITKKISAVN